MCHIHMILLILKYKKDKLQMKSGGLQMNTVAHHFLKKLLWDLKKIKSRNNSNKMILYVYYVHLRPSVSFEDPIFIWTQYTYKMISLL